MPRQARLVLVQESWLTTDGQPDSSRTYHEILVDASTHDDTSAATPRPIA